MSFSDLFAVFSKRTRAVEVSQRPITETFRNRVFMLCRDAFEGTDFWREIHKQLTYLHGRLSLTEQANDPVLDALAFLQGCEDPHFLDFLELIFKTNAHRQSYAAKSFVEDLNEFLMQDNLPYAITDFVWTQGHDGKYVTRTLTAYPQVICKESEALHHSAIQPVLTLLSGPDYVAPNREFLEALEDFRKGDYGDCLTKCGSALESVLKIICTRKNWPYKNTDTVAPLLKIVISNSGLEPFFEQPILQVATLRNKLSKSHGGGVSARVATKSKAQFAINATASAILFLVDEAS